MAESPLLAFYRGSGTDHAGRRYEDILGWGHDRLEGVHDYIQWLFPLQTPSAFNPCAPTLTPDDMAAFRADPGLRDSVRRALSMILDFYGLDPACEHTGSITVRSSDRFVQRGSHWLTPGNHNFLRLTRILKSLSLLGLHDEARALLDCLETLYQAHWRTIGETTLAHWQRAAG